jgi:hypothetical protein
MLYYRIYSFTLYPGAAVNLQGFIRKFPAVKEIVGKGAIVERLAFLDKWPPILAFVKPLNL